MTETTSAGGQSRLVLKVDIDTAVGFEDGTPRLLDLFARLGVRASFFVAMGPDHSGRALFRLRKPGFLKKQLRSGAASAYGPLTMLYGLALPGPIIARRAPELFGRLLAAGHEVGLHGWDHVFWHDRVRHLEPGRVRAHLGRAWRLFNEVAGYPPATFASPGWQVTPEAFAAMAEMGLSHVSCTRGSAPFRPLYAGRLLPLVELPTTLPSMDELLGHGGVTPGNVGAHLAGLVGPGLNVFTCHGEVEGRALSPAFEQMIKLLLERGVMFERLLDAARGAAERPLPAGDITWAEASGRAGELAWQTGPAWRTGAAA